MPAHARAVRRPNAHTTHSAMPPARQTPGAAMPSMAHPQAAMQARLTSLARGSSQHAQWQTLQAKADARAIHGAQAPGFGVLQQQAIGEADVAQPASPSTTVNHTGLPDPLKAGIESLSGMAMDHVKVHYNSSHPAQFNALAYAQGSDIHVAPGQEKHLPHEAWHVVQQAQGRVKPTRQMQGGMGVNDDKGLEREADVMGGRALTLQTTLQRSQTWPDQGGFSGRQHSAVQMKFDMDGSWMQQVEDSVLLEKFGATTSSLWSALRKNGADIAVDAGGSGASYSFSSLRVQISKNWLDSIKAYVEKGTKNDVLGQATAALTHELSHAHDHIVKKESPSKADKTKDDYVIAVLRTELRAWMKEARAARENFKDKKLDVHADNSNLIKGWLGVYFSLKDGKDVLKVSSSDNLVVGRLNKYFLDNQKAKTDTTLEDLLATSQTGLLADLDIYSQSIRAKFTSDDELLRKVAGAAISKG